jgi:MoaA/NifB/PqqE/SkfB family radical SAM enzyme
VIKIYSALKAFRHLDRMQAFLSGRPAPPVQVRVKPVNACIHDCWYCAYRVSNLQLGSQMRLKDRIPNDKLSELARDLVAMGVRAVTFSGGGEPLIHPRLPGVLEILARGGVAVATLTNGALLSGEAAEAFARHGTWVRVSIDGWDGPSYARSRGVAQSEYGKVMGNVKSFAATGTRCAIGFSFIVSQDNAAHIADFCRQASDAGAGHVKLSACVVSNDGKENEAYHGPIASLVAAQIEEARKLEGSSFSLVDHYHGAEQRYDKVYHRCHFMYFLTVIGADCKVYACQDKAYTEAGLLGSIEKHSFREFWFSDENRRRMAQLDPSRDCRHHCVSHEKNLVLDELLGLDSEHVAFV